MSMEEATVLQRDTRWYLATHDKLNSSAHARFPSCCFQHLLDLGMQALSRMASMAFAGLKKGTSLFRRGRLDAPFLGAGD